MNDAPPVTNTGRFFQSTPFPKITARSFYSCRTRHWRPTGEAGATPCRRTHFRIGADRRRLLAVLAARSPRRVFAVDVHPGMSYLDDRDVDVALERSRLVPAGPGKRPCAWPRGSAATRVSARARSRGSHTPMDQAPRKRVPVLRALLERGPLPIEATVGVGVRIDAVPRPPYEVAEAVCQTGAYLRRRRREVPVSRVSARASSGGAARPRPARGPKIAILVVGCLLPVYRQCIRAIRSTWGSRPVDCVDIYYVYGGQNAN